jgi:TolB-like protein
LSTHARIVVQEPHVAVNAATWLYQGLSLALFPFEAPAHLRGVTETVTRAYFRELLKASVFRSIEVMEEVSPSVGRALALTRWREREAFLLGTVSHVLDGSRGQPTHLRIHIRLLDARTGETLWDLEQQAHSQPGRDVDLFWSTLPGESAAGYEVPAQHLAAQLAELFILGNRPPPGPPRPMEPAPESAP